MVSHKITLLLEDAYASGLLMHGSVMLGQRMEDPLTVLGHQIPTAVGQRFFGFRSSLLKGSLYDWPSALTGIGGFGKLFTELDFRTYLRASTLQMPTELFRWYKGGKHVWYATVGEGKFDPQNAPDIVSLCRRLPSESTMIWFENPLLSNAIGNEALSCNLVLYTKIGDGWLLRLFSNPVIPTIAPVITLKEQREVSSQLLYPGTGKVWLETQKGRQVHVTPKERRAWQKLGDFSQKLSRHYAPNGMAGAVISLIEPNVPNIMISTPAQELILQVIRATNEWLSQREALLQDCEQVKVSAELHSVPTKQLPKQQQLFTPDDIFAIRNTRYESTGGSHREHHRSGTGRVVTTEHTRKAHKRTLYRGTPRERTIDVSEARIVPKGKNLSIPPGVLIKPPRQD